jgi:hypothetical protein
VFKNFNIVLSKNNGYYQPTFATSKIEIQVLQRNVCARIKTFRNRNLERYEKLFVQII